MPEGGRVAVEFFPVGLDEQRLELPEHRRPRIRRQHLELREGRAELGRVLDRGRDRAPVVLQEPEDIKRRGDDPLPVAVDDDLALMRRRDRPAAGLAQRRRIRRLDPEADRTEAGRVQPIEQDRVEPIEPRFRLEGQRQPTRSNRVAQVQAAVALLAEQRIAEDHVRPRVPIAQPFELVDDVADRPRAITGDDAVRAVGAELGAAAACEQRVATAHWPGRPLEPEVRLAAAHEIPARERQRVEVGDRVARRHAPRDGAARQLHHAGFRLAVQDEIAVALEEPRQLRGRDADESNRDAALPHPIGPRGFVAVVDERREHERNVALDQAAARPAHVVAGARQNGGAGRQLHARRVVKLLLEMRDQPRDARKGIKTRPKASDYGVFADKTAVGLQVREYHPHEPPPQGYRRRREGRQAACGGPRGD